MMLKESINWESFMRKVFYQGIHKIPKQGTEN